MNIVQIKDIPDKKGRRGVRGEFICHDCTHTWPRMLRSHPKRGKCHMCNSKRLMFVQGKIEAIYKLPGLYKKKKSRAPK